MFIETLQTHPPYFFAVVITVVISITIHELAHGVVAVWLGDRTPIETGHMTLNPVVHLGLFSVIALLVAGIAWGAMPINPSRLRGRFGGALVAVAGPISNVILALLALTALGLWGRFSEGRHFLPPGTPAGNLQFLLWTFGYVNFNLAMFNLIPLPPLDGSRILESLSGAFRRLTENLNNSGASMIVFLVAFSFAGKFTSPAADRMRTTFVEAVSGIDLLRG